MLGYLFFVGNPDSTDLPYLREDSADAWERRRREEAVDAGGVIELARAAQQRPRGPQGFPVRGSRCEPVASTLGMEKAQCVDSTGCPSSHPYPISPEPSYGTNTWPHTSMAFE